MKLIKSSYEILEQAPGLEGIYEAIERAGRVCYKSERPEGKTAKDFVDMLIKRGHLSPLEHGTVYLDVKISTNSSPIVFGTWSRLSNRYGENPYSKVKYYEEEQVAHYYITTNMRVLYENDWLDDLQYLCEPTEYHTKRVGVRVNCSIGISREWNRHRAFSICEQSTRYCNYSKDRFGNELTFIIPNMLNGINEKYLNVEDPKRICTGNFAVVEFLDILHTIEHTYKYLLHEGYTPQQAREVLPLSTATEVIYTGYPDDWSHFFDMRCSPAAHPDIRAIAIPLKEEFIKRNLI